MRITRGRVIKNIILIVFGIIMFGLGLTIAIICKEFSGEAFALFGIPAIISTGCGLADWDEMTNPSTTRGGSN